MVWGHNDFLREVRRQLIELEALRRKLHEPQDDSPSWESAAFHDSDAWAEARSAAEDSLEKIERSQQHLLRKLDELFAQKEDEREPAGSSGADASDEASSPTEQLIECVRNMLAQPGVLPKLLGIDPENVSDAVTIVGAAKLKIGESDIELDEKPGEGKSPSDAIDLEPLLDEFSFSESIAVDELFGDFKLTLDKFSGLELSGDEAAAPATGSVEESSTEEGLLDELQGPSAHSTVFQERCCGCGKLIVSSILAGEQVVQEGGEWFHESCCPSSDDESRFLWQPSVLN